MQKVVLAGTRSSSEICGNASVSEQRQEVRYHHNERRKLIISPAGDRLVSMSMLLRRGETPFICCTACHVSAILSLFRRVASARNDTRFALTTEYFSASDNGLMPYQLATIWFARCLSYTIDRIKICTDIRPNFHFGTVVRDGYR